MKPEVAEFVRDHDDLVLLSLTAGDVDDARTALEEAKDVAASPRSGIELYDLQVMQIDHRIDQLPRGRSGVRRRQGGGAAVARG
jgi:hypothetical protein